MTPNRLGGVGRLVERPTIDVVVLIFVTVTAAIMLAAVGTVAVLEIIDHEIDTDGVVQLLDAHVGTIIGALLGLIAGQSAGRRQSSATLGEEAKPPESVN